MFDKNIYDWINSSLKEEIPDAVVAYCFNLYETGSNFGIELIGSGAFDPENSDWACEEVFVPSNRQLSLPLDYTGATWNECLDKLTETLTKYLRSNDSGAVIFKSCKGVGLGFVDGDLKIL